MQEEKSTQTTFFLLESIFFCGTDSCLGALLNITIVTTWTFSFTPYLHNYHFIPPFPLKLQNIYHFANCNHLSWATLKSCIGECWARKEISYKIFHGNIYNGVAILIFTGVKYIIFLKEKYPNILLNLLCWQHGWKTDQENQVLQMTVWDGSSI